MEAPARIERRGAHRGEDAGEQASDGGERLGDAERCGEGAGRKSIGRGAVAEVGTDGLSAMLPRDAGLANGSDSKMDRSRQKV